jgi:hypothetical protein
MGKGVNAPLAQQTKFTTQRSLPSRILKTTYDDGSSSADLISVHTSHSISPFQSIHRQHLSSTTKNAIRNMISADMTTPAIIRAIQGDTVSRLHRDEFDGSVHRDLFVTTQDVTNLRASDLERGLRRHVDDMFSLHIWVTELEKENQSPIVYYKPAGLHDPRYPDVPTNELLLVIATVAMLDSICRNVKNARVVGSLRLWQCKRKTGDKRESSDQVVQSI